MIQIFLLQGFCTFSSPHILCWYNLLPIAPLPSCCCVLPELATEVQVSTRCSEKINFTEVKCTTHVVCKGGPSFLICDFLLIMSLSYSFIYSQELQRTSGISLAVCFCQWLCIYSNHFFFDLSCPLDGYKCSNWCIVIVEGLDRCSVWYCPGTETRERGTWL